MIFILLAVALSLSAPLQSSNGAAIVYEGARLIVGDGTPPIGPQAGATANHTYSAAGTYNITVTVNDTAALSSTAKRQVKAR